MRVLGLSFSGHGSSICLVEDGRIACALNLERITRRKFSLVALRGYVEFIQRLTATKYRSEPDEYFDFYDVFPAMLEYVTGFQRIEDAGIDLVVKTPDNIRPIPEFGPYSQFVEDYDRFLNYFRGVPVHFEMEHHLAHAYQAFLCSPFEEAAILVVDGSGEQLARLNGNSISTSFNVGRGHHVQVLQEICFPNSVGGVYSAFTRHLGFRANQEGNTMALAAFGTDRFYREIQEDTAFHEGGRYSFHLNSGLNGLRLTDRLEAFCPMCRRGDEILDTHKDAAWAIQRLSEEVLLHAAWGLYERTRLPRLAVAGGVGLNCVANRKILDQTPFEEIYVMPNAGDRGLAAGCALYGYHVLLGGRERHPPEDDYLGRDYSEAEILAALRSAPGIDYRRSSDIAAEAAALIERRSIIGWFQGRAEFGPRALGHRSIVADPRTPDSKLRLDRDIKKREWFRPYAPSVVIEEAGRFFNLGVASPYMLLACDTRPEVAGSVAGIVHVDGSARVQTVDRHQEPRYHRLLSELGRRTGIPMVLNTSFNENGAPVVESPRDAVDALGSMKLDALAIGDYLAWRAGSSL